MRAQQALIACLDEIARGPVPRRAAAAASAVRARHRDAVRALVFYGSALREPDNAERTVDLYVLARSYRAFHRRRVAALANRLLPPNVYRLRTATEGGTVRVKYTVLTLADFERLASPRAFQSLIWGRFSQPCVIAYASDEAVRRRLVDAFADAVRTMLDEALGLMPPRFTAREIWIRAFGESYASEFRAERAARACAIHDAAPDHYRRLAALVLGGDGLFSHAATRRQAACARRRWAIRRIQGRALGAARLTKAAFTFEDGLDYVLDKIARHSGVSTRLTPWQRRHPLLAAPVLACRLYRRRGFR